MTEKSEFSFKTADDKEVLRIELDGRFFVNQKEVETSEEIRDIFVKWCQLAIAAHHDLQQEDRELINWGR